MLVLSKPDNSKKRAVPRALASESNTSIGQGQLQELIKQKYVAKDCIPIKF